MIILGRNVEIRRPYSPGGVSKVFLSRVSRKYQVTNKHVRKKKEEMRDARAHTNTGILFKHDYIIIKVLPTGKT